jgi:hypothetical protein
MLEKTPKNSLRVPFLAQVFPEARFIYLYRDPRQVLSSMIEAWTSGRFQTYPQLRAGPVRPGRCCSYPARALIGRPLHETVAAQWATATRLLIDDLLALSADRWTIARYDALVADPAAEIRRLCEASSLGWDHGAQSRLSLSKYTVSPPRADKWQRHAGEIEAVLPSLAELIPRVERFAAR